MARIYLVRHGKAAASFTEDPDPGLDALGHHQAQEACQALKGKLPLDIISSPLLRAQETAIPLSQETNVDVKIEKAVSEVPSGNISLDERGAWLGAIMEGQWSNQSEALQQWRSGILDFLLSIESDTAVFTHFVTINTAVGIAEGKDQVLMFRPDNASVSILDNSGGKLKLIHRGDEANTKVN